MADFDTATVPLVVNRHVAFSEEIRFVGFNYTGATFTAHVRATKDVAGTPWLTFSFSSPAVTTEEGLSVTTVTMTATKGSVDAIPYPGGTADERGDDVTAWWDLLIDPSGSPAAFRALQGPCTIKAGATIP
jgi:transcriptional regulator GlxA family with amidase domain